MFSLGGYTWKGARLIAVLPWSLPCGPKDFTWQVTFMVKEDYLQTSRSLYDNRL
jgi:hypothetical protein